MKGASVEGSSMDVMDILRESVERKASDVILSAGSPVVYHVHGALVPRDPHRLLTPVDTQDLVYQFLTMEQRKIFEMERELDIGYQITGLARFRVSVYQQRGSVAAVLRIVPIEIPDHRSLGLADQVLLRIVNQPHGLVLITGPTGAGKSTTIASVIEYLNTVYGVPKHVITIEDPIEFLFESKTCVIDQRELGIDTRSFVRGLRSALRQMPHVIFVGEMRDRETMEVALTAAETGNLVISTLSTQSAAKTVNRIIDVFPIEHQAEIRTRLSLTLRAVVSQTLLRRRDGLGRVAAREVMFVNSPISNLIREGKVHQLPNAIGTHYAEGMKLLDDSLLELFREGAVEYVDVVTRIQDPEKLKSIRAK